MLDDLTSLTTVTLKAVEIKDYVPPAAPTFSTRVSRRFGGSIATLVLVLQAIALFLVGAAPWLVVFIILLAIGYVVWRLLRRSTA